MSIQSSLAVVGKSELAIAGDSVSPECHIAPALVLIKNASDKIRSYEKALAWVGRETSELIARLKSENVELRDRIAALEKNLGEADTTARTALANLQAANLHCIGLTREIQRLETDLVAAELHVTNTTGFISRLGAYILRADGAE